MAIDELAVEEVNKSEAVDNDVLKVFVYDNKGQLVKQDLYSDFLNAYDFVLTHNSSNPDDPYNIYPGTVFPPKGYKWSNEKGDWIEINLYEKWQRGELEIPIDCYVIGNLVVRKSLSQLVKEGKYQILPTQKIDEEYNIIIEKDKQELIDEGLASWDEIYNYYYAEFKRKLDSSLDIIYLKYPRAILMQFEAKAQLAKKWLSLSDEEKEQYKAFEFNEFILLISEFKDLSKEYTLNDISLELTKLSQKIVKKNTEMEEKLGKVNNFFDSLHAEIEALKPQKNFMKLFDFVSGLENKINQWIKS